MVIMTLSLGTIPEFQAHCLGNLPGGALSEILAEKTSRSFDAINNWLK